MKYTAIGDSWGKIVAGGGTPWPDLLGIANLNVSGSTAQDRGGNMKATLTTQQTLTICGDAYAMGKFLKVCRAEEVRDAIRRVDGEGTKVLDEIAKIQGEQP